MDKKIDYKKLRDSRVDKDLTQKEMAAKLNIEQSAYNKIEKGKRGIRVEQLKTIADILGRDINEFITGNNFGNENSQNQTQLQDQNTFLKAMLKLYSTNVESELFSLMNGYYSNYPEYELSFDEYINSTIGFPDMVVSGIKYDIEDYTKGKEFDNYYNDFFENGIEYFVGKADSWIMNFVLEEANYGFSLRALHCPMHNSYEDMFSAFKDMLKENELIHSFFQHGLLENSWFSDFWTQYLIENKSTLTGDGSRPKYKSGDFCTIPEIDLDYTNKKREERENIRKKMHSILIL
jgi:transcriptional regulator with XRE-family HTH domain